MSDNISLVDVFMLKGIDFKTEGLMTGSMVGVWAASSYLLGNKSEITIGNAVEIASNELFSRIILKRLISFILHLTGIHMAHMKELNWALSHIGSFILIYLYRHKTLPSIMQTVKMMIMEAISDLLVYPQLAKLMGGEAKAAFDNGYDKMAISANSKEMNTYHNKVDAKIKHPRHKDRYKPNKKHRYSGKKPTDPMIQGLSRVGKFGGGYRRKRHLITEIKNGRKVRHWVED